MKSQIAEKFGEKHASGVPVIWWMGEWIEAADISAALEDRGLLHGLGLFETMLTVDGRAVFVDRHRTRIADAMTRLGWEVALPDLRETVEDLLGRNGLESGRARVRLTVTAGPGDLRATAAPNDARIWVMAKATGDPPESLRATVSPWVRNERSPLAGLKCTSYAENILAIADAQERGFDECLMMNTKAEICEAAMGNVFLVRSGQILTPPLISGCLPGVTRGVVIGLAREMGLVCKEIPLESGDLDKAEEIFLTSAIRGVVGLSALDEREFQPGPVTSAIRTAWSRAIAGNRED